MRDSYLALPTSGLATAGTVMLDWNISARIANIHQRQAKFEKLNLNAAEMIRLRNLVATIPPEAEILGAFGAAEPETRRTRGVANIDRYNERTDIASVYLSQVPGYLLHLLDGGQSDGLLIESEPDDAPYQPDALRSWFMVSYAALLKAIVIDREAGLSRIERLDRFRFWLEHELQVSASREAWIGFLLLAGTGDYPDRARRLLKVAGGRDIRDSVWGATWDLMYSRIPAVMTQPMFRKDCKLPIVFVTDDSALVDALAGIGTALVVENAHGVSFSGDDVDMTALHDDVRPLVRSYMVRERQRVLLHSRGMTPAVLSRAAHWARRSEVEITKSL
jgi:hypothetical protein